MKYNKLIGRNMKRYFLFGCISLIGASAFAQEKIDFSGMSMLEDMYQSQLSAKMGPSRGEGRTAAVINQVPEEIAALVLFSDGYTAEDIERAGYEIISRGESYAIVRMPLAGARELASLDAVKHLSFGKKLNVNMDQARKANYSNVDAAHEGTGLEHSFKGAGVVSGIFDIGLDPNHVNFNDANGVSRVRRLYTVETGAAVVKGYTTPDEIAAFTTENNHESHGTHCLGIMAGGYKGAATLPSGERNVPYYGVAPESEIAITCGDSYATNILTGIDLCLKYAEEVGKPVVVNVSFGHSGGPHDGSTATDKAMGELGRRGIICVAAGNEGDKKISVSKSFLNPFTASPLSTMLRFSETRNSRYDEQIQVWSNDDTPFEFEAFIYDLTANKELMVVPVSNTAGQYVYIAGSNVSNPGGEVHTHEAFDAGYGSNSWVRMRSNVSTDNNRYCVYIESSLATNGNSRYCLGIRFKGDTSAKQVVNAYTTGVMEFTNNSVAGYTDGMTDGSISDMACAPNIFVIGSYNSRGSWRNLAGSTFSYNGSSPVGDVSNFSSYGILFDGTRLPHICAPGSAIISSYSRYYYSSQHLGNEDICAVNEANGRLNHWGPMQGTSMACPFAAGTVALWLEADPTLTVDNVIDIAKRTAKVDDKVEVNGMISVKWGAGKLDATAGLKEVINGLAGVNAAISDEQRLIVSQNGDAIEAFVAGETGLKAVLHNMSGMLAAQAEASGDCVTVDTSALTPGIYVMTVSGEGAAYTHKVVVK